MITIGGVFKTTWLLNGRTFNPAHAEAFPKLNTTETWEIHNQTNVAHVMHLHHTDWYLLERNGKPPRQLRRLPEGDVLRLPQRKNSPCRSLLRLHRKIHPPLPHAGSRGPRSDGPIPGGASLKETRAFVDASGMATPENRVSIRPASDERAPEPPPPCWSPAPPLLPSHSSCLTRAAAITSPSSPPPWRWGLSARASGSSPPGCPASRCPPAARRRRGRHRLLIYESGIAVGQYGTIFVWATLVTSSYFSPAGSPLPISPGCSWPTRRLAAGRKHRRLLAGHPLGSLPHLLTVVMLLITGIVARRDPRRRPRPPLLRPFPATCSPPLDIWTGTSRG